MASRGVTSAVAFCALAASCRFEPPEYGETHFACRAGLDPCPPGMACVAGECRPPENGDARPIPDLGGAADVPGTDVPGGALVFGEVPGAHFSGVTSDTEIKSTSRFANFGAAGNVGTSATGAEIDAVALIRFDISAIPAGTRVVDAKLEVEVTDHFAGDVQVFRIGEAWDEGNVVGLNGAANYNNRKPSVPWSNPGVGAPTSRAGTSIADFVPGPAGAVVTIMLPYTLVETWINNPAQNHGLVLVRKTAGSTNRWAFASSEHMDPARRPRLNIAVRSP